MTTQAKERLIDAWQNTICFEDIVQDMVNNVAENLNPEDVFDEDRLAAWATENGYVKAE